MKVAAPLLLACLSTCPPAWAQPRPVAWPAVRAEMVVDTTWLAAHLFDPGIVVLHVGRDKATFDTGHVCGAQFGALADIAVTHDGIPNEMPPVDELRKAFERVGVADGTRVILYGDQQGLYAARGFVALDYLGHGDRAALLDGGLERWRAEGRSTCTVPSRPVTGSLTVGLRPEVVATMADVKDVVAGKAGDAVLVDARKPKEYSGEEAGDHVTRPGHIPGAKSVFWMETIESEANPALKAPDEVRRLYEAAGVVPGRQPITYCRTGVQASFTYFTLKWLGLEPRLYDGSYVEWSNVTDTEVAQGAPPPPPVP